MRSIFFLILVFLSVEVYTQTVCDAKIVSPVSTFNQCNNNAWILVFEDNFDGDSIDLSKWKLREWAEGALYGNGGRSQEYNTLDNVSVSDGTLKIIAKKETVQRRAISWKPDNEILSDGLPNLRTYHFTSSNIWTKTLFTYGKIEARVKIPKGKGFWPAFWLFGDYPWNEIDIFEFWNEHSLDGNHIPSLLSKVHHMSVHYDYDNNQIDNQCKNEYTGIDFSQDYHTYTVTWERDKIEWLVDGIVKRTDYQYYTEIGQTIGCTVYANHKYIYDLIYPRDPMSIILNLAIQCGKDSIDAPDDSTPFPSIMEVDWVRYYQRETCQDVYITDSVQQPIDDHVFNVIIGNEVDVDCDYHISPEQQLNIIAKSGISLKPGFVAMQGSDYIARIEPSICDLYSMEKNRNDTIDTCLVQKNEMEKSEECEIKVFPNPSGGTFNLDYGTYDFQDYVVIITTEDGRLVNFDKKENSSVVTIVIRDNVKGVCFLYLRNTHDGNVITHKLVIK